MLLLLLFAYACSDGDLDIEIIDFDSVAVDQCGTASTSTTIFFKTNLTEALILELQSGLLRNEASTEELSSSIPGQSNITFRIFSDNVSSSYFCGDFPPATPIVVEEIEAEEGQVLINTVEIDSVTYQHTIQLQGIILINNQGERITDLSISEFGTVTTSAN